MARQTTVTYLNADGEDLGQRVDLDAVGYRIDFHDIGEKIETDLRKMDKAVVQGGAIFGLKTRETNAYTTTRNRCLKDGESEDVANLTAFEAVESIREDWLEGRWGAEKGEGGTRSNDFVEGLARFKEANGHPADSPWRKAKADELRAYSEKERKEHIAAIYTAYPAVQVNVEEIRLSRRQAKLAKLRESASNTTPTDQPAIANL